MDVAQLLQLQRAFERQRIGRAAAEIEHVARAGDRMRQSLRGRLELERLGEKPGRQDEFSEEGCLPRLVDGAARAAEADRQAGHRGELAGEGLGRRDPDLGARKRRRSRVGEPGDARGRHIDDPDRLRPVVLDVAQRSQRVGRLARLRDDDGQAVPLDRRLAVAVFGCDVDLNRQSCEAFDPVFADEARHIGSAAADDRNPGQRPWIDRPGEGFEPHRGHVDVVRERMADDFRLFVDLLGHEVPVIALLGQAGFRPGCAGCAAGPTCRTRRGCRRLRD